MAVCCKLAVKTALDSGGHKSQVKLPDDACQAKIEVLQNSGGDLIVRDDPRPVCLDLDTDRP